MKKTLKRLFAVLGIALLLISNASLGVFADDGDLIILYTNDTHCSTESFAVLAAYRAMLIEDGHKVITVDAGDAIQGEMIGSLTEGAAIAEIMNAVGYDYAVPGNHEFDYTVDKLLSLINDEVDYEFLCANFRYLPEERDVFAPYAIEEIGGKKIAFVGIATPETYTKSTPTYFQDGNGNFVYTFFENDLYTTVQSAVDKVIAEGAETVIAVGHLGIEGVTEGWRSTDLIASTNGIDAFIDGHAHQIIAGELYENKDGDRVLLSSTGSKFEHFGKMTISDDGTVTTELIDPETIDTASLSGEAKKAYDNVKGIIDAYNAEFEYLFEVLGESEAYLTENDAEGNWIIRNGETNLGNFVTDAYLSVTGADVAFVNGGGIRAEIKEGLVDRKTIMDVNPWGNEMCVLEVTGKQLLDALEYGVSAMPEVFGSFPHVAGITFEVHTYVPTPVNTNEMGDFVSVTEGAERRVRNVKVGGETLDESKTYTLAGSCYMLQLSGYKMLDGSKVVAKEDLPNDGEMLVKYFTEALDGRISAEKYGNISGEGRMTVVTEKPDSPTPPTGDSGAVVWVGLLFASILLSSKALKKTHD